MRWTTSSAGRSTGCTTRHSPGRAERPRDAPGGPRGATRGRSARSAATPRSCALRALLHRAARPARRALRRRPALPGAVGRLLDAIAAHRRARATPELRRARPRARDHARTGCSASRRWATSPTSTASPARCAGVRERLPYLRELGVTYLHLMPLLRTRPEPNDGGYAVADYGAVEPALGTMDDLRDAGGRPARARAWRCASTSCSTTRRASTPWAQRRAGGDPRRLAYYRTFADRAEPDAYERTLPEVFPDTAPGNFTWTPSSAAGCGRRSTPYQWDLDYANPEVFARDGRGDARARRGRRRRAAAGRRAVPVEAAWARTARTSPRSTTCCRRSARSCGSPRPRSAFKAEAIVAPRDLVAYLGDRPPRGQGVRPRLPQRAHGPAVERARLAARRAADAARSRPMPPVPAGRRLGDLRALPRRHRLGDHATRTPAAVGEDAHLHRRFLADFYAGDFPGSFARGARFQPEPRTGEARTSGTAASLAGLESALEPADALARSSPCGASCCSTPSPSRHGGLPLIYMGDELGAAQRPRTGPTDPAHATTTAGCTGRRWTGRPPSAAHDPAHRRGPAVGAGCGG